MFRRTLGRCEEYTRHFSAELAKLGYPLGEAEKPGMSPKLPDRAPGVLFDFLAKAGYSLTDLVESNSEELPIARIGP